MLLRLLVRRVTWSGTSLNRRYRYKDAVDEEERAKDKTKSSVRAKVEHPFLIIKRIFGFAKTRYKGLAKWLCFHLYEILDVFSRYVVGWMIAPREVAFVAANRVCFQLRKVNTSWVADQPPITTATTAKISE